MRPNRHPLDEPSAARLLQGAVHPDDAPPGYAPVAQLLATAGSVPPVDEDAAEATICAMVEAIRDSALVSETPRRKSMIGKLLAGKALAALAIVGLTATGAAAATGSLPDPVQGAVAEAVSKVGVDIPKPKHGKSAEHRKDAEHRQDGQHGRPAKDGESGDGSTADNKGMSDFVHDTKDAGLPVGPTVCAEASDGKCHAGENNPGKGGGEGSTTSTTEGSKENPGRAKHTEDKPKGDDGDDEVVPPSTPTPPSTATTPSTGSIQTGADHSGRNVAPSGKGKPDGDS